MWILKKICAKRRKNWKGWCRYQSLCLEHNLAKRCISYDSHPLVNENAIPYEGVYVEPPKVRRCFPYSNIREDDILSEVAACCKQIEQRGIDITDGYDQWLKVGCSLATLGEDGRDFFHLCSQQSMDYNESNTDKMFSDLLKRNYQNSNIGTFFWLCKQDGIKIKWKLRWKSKCLHQTKQVSEIIARRKTGWNLIRFEPIISGSW